MIIRSATFIKSSLAPGDYPAPLKPEFGFIGRSNVGKSSLINMLTEVPRLAKTSGQPGKTKTINHFSVDDIWYIADLPGYGYAKVPVKMREEWTALVRRYILERKNLVSLFVLIDSRLKPQRSDLEFMEFLGMSQVSFARIFTKSDKLSETALKKSILLYDNEMLERWETLPVTIITSAVTRRGRTEILDYIKESINKFSSGG
jgi:GTP-binding protein